MSGEASPLMTSSWGKPRQYRDRNSSLWMHPLLSALCMRMYITPALQLDCRHSSWRGGTVYRYLRIHRGHPLTRLRLAYPKPFLLLRHTREPHGTYNDFQRGLMTDAAAVGHSILFSSYT